MSDSLEYVIIGAGVVGLAIARALAIAGKETFIVEQHGLIGSETSSRNSEVIHAGIYYPKGSLKAKLCVAGKAALYAYCDEHHVPYRRCGKLIVATSVAELPLLEALAEKARDNGVSDLEHLSASAAKALEPELSCEGALLSPSTGIIDSHALMFAFQTDAENAGAILALKNRICAISFDDPGFTLEIEDESGAREAIQCQHLINSAGLSAPDLARTIRGFPAQKAPPSYYCKGSYFALSGVQPFSRLIYPVPEAAGLGVHSTVDIAGQVRFGPDTEWVEEANYDTDAKRAEGFYAAIRKYYPALENGQLHPAYSGIRPKITPAGEAAADFVLQGPDDHQVPGLVNLFGIESPSLTASPAIAEEVRQMI